MATLKKDNKWYIQGALKKEDGTWYRYTKRAEGCKTKKEATEFERQFRMKWQDIEIKTTNITFKNLSEEYMKQRKDIKSSTLITDQDILDKFNVTEGHKIINLMTKKKLQEYISQLEEKGYSKEYVKKYYYTIKKVFRYAVQQEYIQVNPMENVTFSKRTDVVKKEMLFWEPDEFNVFIQYVKNEQLKIFFMFIYYMGTRKGEAMALTWKDIDFANKTVSISKTVTYKTSDGPYAITSPKTRNSIRNIDMPDVIINLLQNKKTSDERCAGYNDDCFVFGFDRPLAAETVRKNLIKSIEAANKDGHELKQIRVHDFRHSHVSYLVNNMGEHKFSDYEIAQRLGDTVETIQTTYAHMFKGAQERIIEFMNADIETKKKPTTCHQSSIDTDEFIKLYQLLDMGIISQEEFDLKKKQMLGI